MFSCEEILEELVIYLYYFFSTLLTFLLIVIIWKPRKQSYILWNQGRLKHCGIEREF